MECSGVVRRAFCDLGHDAWSCDLKDAEDGSVRHIKGDVLNVIDYDQWDLCLFFPDCTFLTVSAAWAFNDPDYEKYPGVGYHQKPKSETLVGAARREARNEALAMIGFLMGCGYPYCIENPSRGFISGRFRPADQIIQPYMFGHDASKSTGLWLKGLAPLQNTKRVPPRMVDGKPRWANQTDSGQNRLTPSDSRSTDRARTYEGVAEAMANQWGGDD